VGGVVAGLKRVLGAGIEHTPRERAVRPEAWELLVQGRALLNRFTHESGPASRELLSRCVGLDPELALGWAELARCEQFLHLLGLQDEPHLERGFDHVRRALELDPEEARAHMVLGLLLAMRGEHETALAAAQRALDLAPGDAALRLDFATLLIHVNRNEEAIPMLKNLTRLDPAQRYMHLFQLGLSYRRLGRTDEALAKHRECVAGNPDFFGAHMQLAAIHASLGEMNQARAALAEVLRLHPDFSIARIPLVPTGREMLVENLRKAGLRE
jgi:adenylate cyclase